MSYYFGNSLSLSMEGTSVRFFSKKDTIVYQYDTSIVVDQDKSIMHFHPHLSDNAFQNICTTNYYMCVFIENLLKTFNLIKGSYLLRNTDGLKHS